MKVLKEGTAPWVSEAIAEVYALDLCVGHPNICQLLDVTMRDMPNRVALVFEEWGEDLRQSMHRVEKRPEQVREILLHVTRGLAHLHTVGLIHCDLKPANILIKEASGPREASGRHEAWSRKLACEVADLECCVAAASEHRPAEPVIQKQTLNYRAPEILFGCPDFAAEVFN